ncbi:hypothetical protein [Mycobacterium shigaense]|uniref:Uncharacterized protein n=1 Tax=Mycobacterium shigaense TaxID=722731 RepID=A0A1Z4EMW0_9MYCO|nr:hypothetical protein [Mycobacterium shigaense]PRI13039.1 hypothetical protein B2J96_23520 [Mycobacterium shigaense]BAX94250.1 hypothetical protein MSG_04129 [Mycobacterium shigaense]
MTPAQIRERETVRLRSELLRRVEAHPVRSWSPTLLSAMIAVGDHVVENGLDGTEVTDRPELRVVR